MATPAHEWTVPIGAPAATRVRSSGEKRFGRDGQTGAEGKPKDATRSHGVRIYLAAMERRDEDWKGDYYRMAYNEPRET